LIIDAIKEKKGKEIVIIDLTKTIHSPSDFFVICSATSNTQIDAIASNIVSFVKKTSNLNIWQEEGRNSNWRLLDYVNIVIHIFKEDTRDYYKLEELWSDGEINKIS